MTLYFSVALSASDRLSTSVAIRAPLLLHGLNLKPSFVGILEVSKFLLTVSGISLGGTPSTY